MAKDSPPEWRLSDDTLRQLVGYGVNTPYLVGGAQQIITATMPLKTFVDSYYGSSPKNMKVFTEGLYPYLEAYIGNWLETQRQSTAQAPPPQAVGLSIENINTISLQLTSFLTRRPLSDGTVLPRSYTQSLPTLVRGSGPFVSSLAGTEHLGEQVARFFEGYRNCVIKPCFQWTHW